MPGKKSIVKKEDPIEDLLSEEEKSCIELVDKESLEITKTLERI